MCIAFPLKIKALLPDSLAMAESDGIERRVSVRLLKDVAIGDYVLVHAGYAIERITAEQAEGNLALFSEMGIGKADGWHR